MKDKLIGERSAEEILREHTHNVALLDRLTEWHWSFVLKAMEEYASQFKPKSSTLQEWVLVENGLPELCEKVTVCLSDETVLVGRLYSNGWSAFFMDGESPVIERTVIAWQPLPSPPNQQ